MQMKGVLSNGRRTGFENLKPKDRACKPSSVACCDGNFAEKLPTILGSQDRDLPLAGVWHAANADPLHAQRFRETFYSYYVG